MWRVERDTLGEVRIPEDFYWGAQTQRAIENFKISDFKIPEEMIKSLAVIKYASAKANKELGLLDEKIADAISQAALEVYEGKFKDNFPLDVFQTGSGTSTNMNINEVIANRANEILGKPKGSKFVHPNDHVNKCQSSNDVIPTSISISSLLLTKKLLEALDVLENALFEKEREFSDVIKLGRTHLMDATPITCGQEFSGWREQVSHAKEEISNYIPRLSYLPLGGTAVGTGINAHPDFPKKAIKHISDFLNHEFKETPNHFFSQSTQDIIVSLSGKLKLLAVALYKIANDIRWLSSGPRGGIGEFILPSLQPGSSIMPGKVNPVIPEAVQMASIYVMGADTAISFAGSQGNFQLITMLPLIGYLIINSLKILSNSALHLAEKCINGIKLDIERIRINLEKSSALVTPLALKIGYDKAAEIAKKAFVENKTIKEIVREMKILSDDEIEKILDPKNMVKPNVEIVGSGGG